MMQLKTRWQKGRVLGVLVWGAIPFALNGCSAPGQKSAPPGMAPLSITLESRAFANNARIPRQFTNEGANTSPPLNWQHVPSDPEQGAQSLALICHDPDAPSRNFVHWVIWNLPPAGSLLAPALPRTQELVNGARQGKNSFGTIGYSGPRPPKGQTHHYVFEVLALDQMLSLAAGSDEAQLRAAMQGHILARGELTGRYP